MQKSFPNLLKYDFHLESNKQKEEEKNKTYALQQSLKHLNEEKQAMLT